MLNRKIIQWEQVKTVRSVDTKTVLVGGCFDILHYGHVRFLQSAKQLGEELIVALEPDEFIIKKKKRTPIHTQIQRAEILAELQIVDKIICLPFFSNDAEYEELVRIVHPTAIAITEGDNQSGNKKKQAALVGARFEQMPFIKSFSTTSILHI